MANVGLLFVGAVLFLNGLMLLGKVDSRAAAIFNLFVGGLQVLTPTYLIIAANQDSERILLASGIFLFGFTYLYVGIGLLMGLDTTGVGYYSLFVSIVALGYSFVSFRQFGDQPFGVIWLYWAFLWFLFFLLLGLKLERLTPYVGWVTAIEGWVTGVIPAFLLLSGYWVPENFYEIAIALGAFGVLTFGGLWFALRHRRPGRPAEEYGAYPAGSHG
ncbi:transporter [Streptomyces spinoverrucosus]|uniref:Transporter n=1 Tax=Streptomyces spinoverrucosus TaxID=284043 RepID=A0A4Y3VUY7_9ACTN|nr:AmiS/UreI family transporter [Streptomyces spinoverrucosus]GEC10068.1 transporter [Streptomyces spinoverrucosus]GHB70796.1 transporter [Streptomyces spinoverrucosus]